MKLNTPIISLLLFLIATSAGAKAEEVFVKGGIYVAQWAKSAVVTNNSLRKFEVIKKGEGPWIFVKYMSMPPEVSGEDIEARKDQPVPGRLKLKLTYETTWVNTNWIVTARRVEGEMPDEKFLEPPVRPMKVRPMEDLD